MLNATIYDTYMIIEGTEEEKTKVKEALTFQDNSAQYTHLYQRHKWDGSVKLWKEKELGVIVLPGLQGYLTGKLGDTITFKDEREKLNVHPDESMGITLRPYQKEAVEKVFTEQHGIVLVPTAGGKTYIASAIAKGFGDYKCVYIVHRLVLLQQVRAVLESALGETVGILGGGTTDVNHRIVVAMVGTLCSKGATDKKVVEFAKEVRVAIVDEVQHSGAKMYVAALGKFPKLTCRIGLTGTLPEDALSETRIRGVIGDVLYTIQSETLASEGFVVMPKVTMIHGDWSVGLKNVFKTINWYRFGAEREAWDKVRFHGIINNDIRNNVVKRIVAQMVRRGVTGILVLVDIIEHGETLSKNMDAPFIFGGSDKRLDLYNDFKLGKIPVLISSPVLDEGVDILGIKTVVLAAGGKSKVKLLQRIGRGMRKQKGKFDCEIVDFYDSEINMIKKHSESRLKIYREEGYVITDIEERDIL